LDYIEFGGKEIEQGSHFKYPILCVRSGVPVLPMEIWLKWAVVASEFKVRSMLNGKDGVSTIDHYDCGVWL
jgi:hypothetical protein